MVRMQLSIQSTNICFFTLASVSRDWATVPLARSCSCQEARRSYCYVRCLWKTVSTKSISALRAFNDSMWYRYYDHSVHSHASQRCVPRRWSLVSICTFGRNDTAHGGLLVPRTRVALQAQANVGGRIVYLNRSGFPVRSFMSQRNFDAAISQSHCEFGLDISMRMLRKTMASILH